ncbi:MAG: hypothetical protein LBJ64_02340 [Deltaproteobacteria bacterium]|jgi:hypothetical protein|nr:hypothetical protein [Deltaproteobacteria bacterium]
MKILNFNPPLVKTGDASTRQTEQKPSADDFGSYLDQARSKALMDKISIENRLASQGSVEDVGMAGSLLNALVGQIHACRPQLLDKVHNLEGILYYYQL